MTYHGVVKGNLVLLEEGVSLPDGAKITVTVERVEREVAEKVTLEQVVERQALVACMQEFGQRLAGRHVNHGDLTLEGRSWRTVPRLVLDASIVVKWLNPHESLADNANLIRDDYEQGQISVLVPACWDYEVVNGINKAVARGDLSDKEGREAIALLLAVPAQKEPLPSPRGSYNPARRYQRSV